MNDPLSARSVLSVLAFAMLLVVGAHSAQAAGPGNLYVSFGVVDADDFGRLDTDNLLDEYGLGANYLGDGWDAHLELNLYHSEGDVTDPTSGVTVQRELSEFGFGVRKYWGPERMHPDLGGGISWMKFKNAPSSQGTVSDGSVGLWVDGGVGWDVGGGVRLGFRGRVSSSTGIGVDSSKHGGGYHLNVQVGWGWGE